MSEGEQMAIGSFSVYRNEPQRGIPSRTFTKLVFEAERWNEGWFDMSTSTYLCRRDGIYSFRASMQIGPSAPEKSAQLVLYKGDTPIAHGPPAYATSSFPLGLQLDADTYAELGDEFSLRLFHDFGFNTADVIGGSVHGSFSGHYVGEAQ